MKNTRSIAHWLFAGLLFGAAIPSLATLKNRPEKVQFQIADTTPLELAQKLKESRSADLYIEKNRVISINYIAARKGKPTYLFLPGVNRSLSLDEAEARMVTEKGNGIISFDFSTQPLSVSKLGQNVKPYFRDPLVKITLSSLAEEVDLVAQQFQAMGVKQIIPVSLSYSGAVTPYLKNYPLIIETAPMTSANAASPELAKYIQNLRSYEPLNPIFGPIINRGLIDQAYRQSWSVQVKNISEAYNLPKEKNEDMIEGYMTMSRAAEDFDWSQVDVSTKTNRAFIVGENEASELFRSQAQTFLRLSRANKNVSFFVITQAGHIVPVDQPEAYSVILEKIANPQGKNLGGGIYDSRTKQLKSMTRVEMEAFVEDVLRRLP